MSLCAGCWLMCTVSVTPRYTCILQWWGLLPWLIQCAAISGSLPSPSTGHFRSVEVTLVAGRMSAWIGRLCLAVRAASARGAVYGGGGVHRVAAARQALSPQWLPVRSLSASSGTSVSYEELKDLLTKDGVVLIDVREPWEIKEYGVIKGSLNIPLGELLSALQMTPKDFEEKYKRKLPEKSNTLVFSCLVGIRSDKALGVATSLGYSKIHHYTGGFGDWTKHESPEKPS